MARTINTHITGPVVLGRADNPLYITSTGAVTSTGSGNDGIDAQIGIATVNNAGEITSSGGLGVSLSLGFVANSGSISGTSGVYLSGSDPGSVTNAASGTISGLSASGSGVYIGGTFGTVDNAGLISGGAYGVRINHNGRVTNSGSIIGGGRGGTGANGVGVYFAGRGSVTNNASGSISGGAFGVFVGSGSGTVANSGSITGQYGVGLEAGGSVTNAAGASISGQTAGVFSSGGAAILNNTGTISATATGSAGADLERGGSVTNNAGGSISGNNYGIFITGGSGLVTNAGTISGGSYSVFMANSATNRLVVDPGAVFNGAVNGGRGTLELASGTGSVGGVGTGSFNNFRSLFADPGANWRLNGANIVPNVTDNGTVAIASSLDVSTAINPSSTGLFQIDGGATFEVGAATGSQTQMSFLASSKLVIDNAGSFGTNVGTASYAGSQLQNFAAGDMIDIKNFAAAGAALNFDSSKGLLQISNGAHQVASLDFQTSSLGSGAFHAASDGATGIFITHS